MFDYVCFFRFLIKAGNHAEAGRVLCHLRTGRQGKEITEGDVQRLVGDELDSISAVVEDSRKSGEASWSEILKHGNLRRWGIFCVSCKTKENRKEIKWEE